MWKQTVLSFPRYRSSIWLKSDGRTIESCVRIISGIKSTYQTSKSKEWVITYVQYDSNLSQGYWLTAVLKIGHAPGLLTLIILLNFALYSSKTRIRETSGYHSGQRAGIMIQVRVIIFSYFAKLPSCSSEAVITDSLWICSVQKPYPILNGSNRW